MQGQWVNDALTMLATWANGAPFRMNQSLFCDLDDIDNMCRRASGELRSRQIIAAVILAWCLRHPTERPIEFL
jgi:hypothetical protein